VVLGTLPKKNSDIYQRFEKLLAWDFDKLIIAHGGCIERDAKPFVERAFRGFLARDASW
jgi:hypothetical protein